MLTAALMARGGQKLMEFLMVMLGLRLHTDDDGSCCISRLTGEQPVVPLVVAQCDDRLYRICYFLTSPTRQRVTKEHQNKRRLATWQFVWLCLDRVRRPLEAPHQGFFKVLRQTVANFTIKVKGKSQVVVNYRVGEAGRYTKFPSINSHWSTTCGSLIRQAKSICSQCKLNQDELYNFTTRKITSESKELIERYAIPLVQLLGSSNSCINPWVYCLYSTGYRENFRLMISCRKQKAPRKNICRTQAKNQSRAWFDE